MAYGLRFRTGTDPWIDIHSTSKLYYLGPVSSCQDIMTPNEYAFTGRAFGQEVFIGQGKSAADSLGVHG